MCDAEADDLVSKANVCEEGVALLVRLGVVDPKACADVQTAVD